MNKSITQANQNDKQISKSIEKFFKRFHISSALKASNAYKKKGIPVIEVFQYLFLLIFSTRSMHMNLTTGRNTPGAVLEQVSGNRDSVRGRFLLSVMYESSSRINEILLLKRKDLEYTGKGEVDIHFWEKGNFIPAVIGAEKNVQ